MNSGVVRPLRASGGMEELFYITEMSDVGFIRPADITGDIKSILREQFGSKYIGRYLRDVGLVLDVLEVTELSHGKSIIGSPNIYVRAKFKVLTYLPLKDEIVEGEVENIVDYGMFVSIGPISGFVHISQLGDDVFIHRAGVLQSKKAKITFRKGDRVRARITTVSKPSPTALLRGEPIVKVSLTMRQPKLGKIEEKGKEKEASG